MDAIAAAAHVNKALLYYYFRSKDELYEAVLDEFFQRLRARIDHALDSGSNRRRASSALRASAL